MEDEASLLLDALDALTALADDVLHLDVPARRRQPAWSGHSHLPETIPPSGARRPGTEPPSRQPSLGGELKVPLVRSPRTKGRQFGNRLLTAATRRLVPHPPTPIMRPVTGDDGVVEGESRLEGRAAESRCSSVVERFGAMNAGLNCNLAH